MPNEFTVRIAQKAYSYGRNHRSGVYLPNQEKTVDIREGNQVWAMDFMADQLFNGQRLRFLTIVDAYSAAVPPPSALDFPTKPMMVISTLDEAIARHGCPKTIRVDNGPEFISKELDLWAWTHGVKLDFSRPGKPTDNAFIESFIARVRQECLNTHWFLSLNDARIKIESWRCDYNTVRPHTAIGNLTPAEDVDLRIRVRS